MQFGKTLVGAIIGGAVGIGLLVVVFLLFRWDQSWLAIVVALLTGLGVRMMVANIGRPSIIRGAVTALLALAIYLVGWLVVPKIVTATAPMMKPVAQADKAGEGEAKDAAEGEAAEADAAVEPAKAPMAPLPNLSGAPRAPGQQALPVIDVICLCVAALVAYELGRNAGSGMPPEVDESGAPREPAPAGTHPDA